MKEREKEKKDKDGEKEREETKMSFFIDENHIGFPRQQDPL